MHGREVVLRIIAILLILNGVAGLVAVWQGRQLAGEVLADAREASTRQLLTCCSGMSA